MLTEVEFTTSPCTSSVSDWLEALWHIATLGGQFLGGLRYIHVYWVFVLFKCLGQ